jgi:hypothetical protein
MQLALFRNESLFVEVWYGHNVIYWAVKVNVELITKRTDGMVCAN